MKSKIRIPGRGRAINRELLREIARCDRAYRRLKNKTKADGRKGSQ